ncbi:MAG: hypothetical protein IPF52_14380 [Saprospiraceae bacterium]|nr:hypothetical protein [Saprospiraceae bacterium]
MVSLTKFEFTDICVLNDFLFSIDNSTSFYSLLHFPTYQNITVSCGGISRLLFFLSYSNTSGVCSISGQVLSTESGNYTACGGTMLISWTYTDQCNRTHFLSETNNSFACQ